MAVLLETSVTVNPELAVGLRANGAVPITRLLSVPKLMVWLAGFTVKLRMTVAAAA